ncbi:uncharacterized protein LOC126909200 [Daktulosphaira vitifoliae]|uniref:uncharacterized protein LOC126909200 n=1 Tax=Daktulosphaira vitifoliae TaxID=58002 RepID=UPI0021AA277F|nr:uncharacterized protein LOC126909200 [Daktulosphaira vitifoliae]
MYNQIVLIFCFVCTFITYINASSSSSDNKQPAIRLFNRHKNEATGMIGFKEFKNMFGTELNENKLLQEFTKYANGNNQMDLNGLNNLLDDTIGNMTEKDYNKVFKAIDSNNDGQISVGDLHTIIDRINPDYKKNIEPSLNINDKDKNRLISLKEFLQVMNDLKE